MHLVRRKTCRVCGSSALSRVIDLGDHHLQGAFVKPGEDHPPKRRIPTSLVRCNPMEDEKACGLLQMEFTVPPEVLYSSYWYRSGTNKTMRSHLEGITKEVKGLFEMSLGANGQAMVLDIGCNDGTLLKNYPENYERYGVDPSDVAQEIGGNIKVVNDFFPSDELTKITASKKFDAITSIAMFYDLEDPLQFTRAIKAIMAPKGFWVFEVAYMPSMLRLNSYDTICHEHLEYYSLSVIEYILRKTGLKIFNVAHNSINGGSIRCFVTHTDNFSFKNPTFLKNLRRVRQEEFDLELDSDKPYKNFQERIERHRSDLHALLVKLKKQGKKIHIYGASTKGNTILQWAGVDCKIIDYAAERNPDKYGASTLGTDIPIISEEESRAMKPDYYLVLPWHFKDEFLDRERETVTSGTSLIFPLPEIQVITAQDLK